jgi:hypothetical protein
MPLIIDRICPAERRGRNLRPGGQRDVLATSEAQQIPNVGRPTASPVGHGGDARDLDPGPAEQHGQGACVVGVATQICVEVNTHSARMPAVAGAPVSNPRAITEEDVRYMLQQAYLGTRPLPERN